MNAPGISLTEIMATMAVLGLVAALSVPFALTSWQAATLKAGAEELVTTLNGARQLALDQNQTVCVTNNGSTLAYRVSSCGAPPWTGLGTEGDGGIRLASSVRVAAATANVTFNYLGASGTGGTFTVLNPASGRALCVVVAPSGRITIAGPTIQPVCP